MSLRGFGKLFDSRW